MAIDATDWTIDRATGNIRYTGDDHNGTAPTYATVIEFHRWLQDLADDAEYSVASGDELDIVDDTPSERSTDNIITLVNGFNIDDGAAEHLYDGSIIQAGGNTIYDGIVNFGNAGVLVQIHQNGAVLTDDWWNYSDGGTHTGAADASVLTDSAATWTADELIGYFIYNTTDGSFGEITDNTSTTVTATLVGGTENDWDNGDAYLIAKGLNSDAANGISHRFMLKVRDAAADIDGRRLIGTTRRWGKTFTEFKINGTARGNNVLALSDATDLNNATAFGTVDAYNDVYITRTTSSATVSGVNNTGQTTLNTSDGTQFTDGDFIMIAGDDAEYQITNIVTNALTLNRNLEVATTGGEAIYDLGIGYRAVDVDNDTTDENYYAEWDKGAKSINQFYERMKYLSRDGSEHYIYGLPGELFRGITHEIDVDGASGTLPPVGAITWSGGTGQLLATDSPTAATKIWIQLLTGSLPADNVTITATELGGSVNAELTGGSITERSISSPFVGQSTGSALIGSYGLTLEAADLSNTDTVFDLTNTAVTPPNNVTFTVSGLVSGEDYILVTNDSSGIDFTQMATDTTLSATNETEVSINPAPGIPADTPSTGTIRIELDDGRYRKVAFTGRNLTTDTFTIGTTDFSAGNASTQPKNVFVAYIDKLATGTSENFQTVYNADRTLFIRVRDGGTAGDTEGIVTIEQTGSLNSTGGSVSVNRISDA